jgi:hypothetical protein
MNRAALEQKIVALAWKDDTFRKAFLADPKKQFEEKLGTKLPAALRITAVQEDEDHLHFVIPRKPAVTSELSDAELQNVAGGIDVVVGSVIAITAIVSSSVLGAVSVKEVSDRDGWNTVMK